MSVATSTQQETQDIRTGIRATPGFGLALLVGLYVVFMPNINVLPDVEPYNSKRIFELLILLAWGIWLILSRQARAAWLDVFGLMPRWARWMLGAILAGGVMSAVLAPMPRFGLLEVGHLTLLFGLALSLSAIFRAAPRLVGTLFLGTVALSIGFYCITFAVTYASTLALSGDLWPKSSYIGFSHVRFLNQFQTLTLPLVVVPVFYFARTAWQRALWMLPAACWWTILLAAGGRGTALAVLIAFIVVLILFRKDAFRWMGWQMIAILFGLALYGILFAWLPDAQSLAVELPGTEAGLLTRDLTEDNSRVAYIMDGLEMVRGQWLLGIGPMHYSFGDARAAHPHNAIVQWGVEWGLPSVLALTLLVGMGLWAWLRQSLTLRHTVAWPQRAVLRVAVTASVVAALAHALVSGIIVMPLSQVMLALLAGWTWGLFADAKQHVEAPEGTAGQGQATHKLLQKPEAVLLGVVLLALVSTGWGVLPDVFALQERQATYITESGARWLLPRFWQQGFIGYYP